MNRGSICSIGLSNICHRQTLLQHGMNCPKTNFKSRITLYE